MIKVNEYRCNIIKQFGLNLSVKFMDELQRWDSTVTRNKLYDMFYKKDVLDMLLTTVLKNNHIKY